MMNKSNDINELATALAVAQGVIEGAAKDAANPFFKSSYADLASIWNVIRKPLSDNGLAVMQLPSAEGPKVTITTILSHKSGQFISSELTITAKEDTPQAVGSAITYARRYALQSVVGVAPEDDDGEGAQGRARQQPPAPASRQQVKPNAHGIAPVKGSAEEARLREMIRDSFGKLRQKFIAGGVEGQYIEILGAHGFMDPSEIPANRDLALTIVNEMKQVLADMEQPA